MYKPNLIEPSAFLNETNIWMALSDQRDRIAK